MLAAIEAVTDANATWLPDRGQAYGTTQTPRRSFVGHDLVVSPRGSCYPWNAMTDEHAAAKAMYRDYLARLAVLEPARAYASAVAKATSGTGQTPVEPLATMGKNGGPLLCDVCEKPMILEGGSWQGVYADEAWRQHPVPGWTSWISGGMVVRIETNGTLRVFHGYPNRSGCVQKFDKIDDKARKEFKANAASLDASGKLELLGKYFKKHMPELNNDDALTEIYKVLFIYDPGLGINKP